MICGDSAAQLAGEAVETTGGAIDWPGVGVCLIGLVVLGVWLCRYDGPKALAKAPIRRHGVSMWLAFLLFFVWIVVLSLTNEVIGTVFGGGDETELVAARNVMMLALDAMMIAVMLAAGYLLFARRLKGFGLNPKTLPKDAGWAAVNLVAVYPLIMGGVAAALFAGRLLRGDDFAIETHQSLAELAKFEQLWVRILVIFLVVGIVPVFEEMLFRGLMQSALKSLLPGTWPAVLITSALFALVHSPTHALGIFALSCGLGYAYERSGSLFRPILMHIFFNAISVAALMWL
jgi:membrane protease YdiL (CAAX protease family)